MVSEPVQNTGADVVEREGVPLIGASRADSPAARVSNQDERALLQDLRTGDDKAYRQLVECHGPRIRATVLRLLRNEADANDVVQEAFLSAFRSVGRFEGKSELGTWLHRIAINSALMRIRSKKRHPEADLHDALPRFTDGGTHVAQQQSFTEMPDQAVLREESCELARMCVDQLPENYRNALLLKDIEELDYPEVSRTLGLTINATRIRVHRARQALRTLLAPHFGGDAG